MWKAVGLHMTTLEFRHLMIFLRERQGLSARGVSKQAQLSESYVSKMESGKVIPTVESFARIVDVLKPSDKEIVYLLSTLIKKE